MRSLIRVIVSRNGFRSLEAVDGELIVSRRIGIAPNGPQRVLIFRRSPRTVEYSVRPNGLGSRKSNASTQSILDYCLDRSSSPLKGSMSELVARQPNYSCESAEALARTT